MHSTGRHPLCFEYGLKRSGSVQILQRKVQRLEPYHTAENKTYKPEYLAGFAPERYGLGINNAWELTIPIKVKVYQFMVNGQNGKVAGGTPISKPKVIIAIAVVLLMAALFLWMLK